MPAACKGFFVTGTDTGCGKTLVTTSLMHALKRDGVRVSGMKPVASGCDHVDGRLVNDDAARIRSACSGDRDYDDINPWALMDPVAPHIAARRDGRRIDLAPVIEAYRRLQRDSQVIVVEGIGGWLVPLAEDVEQADLVRQLELPVILVVALRLGCINHARLTAAAIRQARLPLAGWIANHSDPEYDSAAETLSYLGRALDAPLLGECSYTEDPETEPETTFQLDFIR